MHVKLGVVMDPISEITVYKDSTLAMLLAAQELSVPIGQTIAAYAVGDAHTNLLNPFWAIPLLAITGLRARDMFGYGITMMLLLVPFLAGVLYFLPY